MHIRIYIYMYIRIITYIYVCEYVGKHSSPLPFKKKGGGGIVAMAGGVLCHEKYNFYTQITKRKG